MYDFRCGREWEGVPATADASVLSAGAKDALVGLHFGPPFTGVEVQCRHAYPGNTEVARPRKGVCCIGEELVAAGGGIGIWLRQEILGALALTVVVLVAVAVVVHLRHGGGRAGSGGLGGAGSGGRGGGARFGRQRERARAAAGERVSESGGSRVQGLGVNESGGEVREWIRAGAGWVGCGGKGRPACPPTQFYTVLGLKSPKCQNLQGHVFAFFHKWCLEPFCKKMS